MTPAPVPTATPTATATPSADKDSYQAGICLDTAKTIREVTCDRPHNFEVMLSKRLEQRRRPSVRSMSRTCWSALKTYLSSTDTAASRLEATHYGPWKGKDGKWRFSCLAAERGRNDKEVRRTGSLAGALAGGLGAFQLCLEGEPLDEGPLRVVPCSRPHRSEAIPGVMAVDDFPPGRKGLMKVGLRAGLHCEKPGAAYLGGTRRGAESRGVAPTREAWLDGFTDAVCFVVSKTPVKGVMKSTGRP
ncbi:septum formation family protein [Nonomuraea turkmeniaca]|uniref:septum formation family protein n=1 Tax=Nonomuraea turkmeniaca TaxID=103838 RepID=UPI001B8724F6|nr:septum formation family protein [Nonomuraea turkmeniaca]